jgi:dephospho-CoA kinase
MSRRVIGLTGGIGVGKSTVAAMLAELGAVVVDCDQLGRDVAARGGSAFDSIVAAFGPTIVDRSGEIDRAALAAIVFNDPAELETLNAITHPAIDAQIAEAIGAAPEAAIVVLDMAVLVESNLGQGQYGRVLVIEAPLADRIQRLAQQRSMSAEQATARMESQATDEQRRAVADAVIVNDGDLGQLRSRIESWWMELTGGEVKAD